MSPFRVCTLYSGSGGNATYIKALDTEILIDAGKNARALCRALSSIGSDIENIKAIFITHEHTDHISALEVISKKHSIPIHIMEKSAAKIERDAESFAARHLVKYAEPFTVQVGDLTVCAFRTPHDSLMSVGYRIELCCGERRHAIGVATDIGYVTEEIAASLVGCEAVVLESNHDEDMLRRGPYPQELKKRILSKRGHLSNKDASVFGAYLASHGTRAFILAHLSEENNAPDIATDAFVSAIADESVNICAASADMPCEMIF